MSEYDVIVVGGGNAAFCAGLAAQEQGAKVLMLEAAPEDEAGGNSRFTAGSIRVVYNGVEDIKTLIPDLSQQELNQLAEDYARDWNLGPEAHPCDLKSSTTPGGTPGGSSWWRSELSATRRCRRPAAGSLPGQSSATSSSRLGTRSR